MSKLSSTCRMRITSSDARRENLLIPADVWPHVDLCGKGDDGYLGSEIVDGNPATTSLPTQVVTEIDSMGEVSQDAISDRDSDADGSEELPSFDQSGGVSESFPEAIALSMAHFLG
jgi:hypothetical protein